MTYREWFEEVWTDYRVSAYGVDDAHRLCACVANAGWYQEAWLAPGRNSDAGLDVRDPEYFSWFPPLDYASGTVDGIKLPVAPWEGFNKED